MSPGPISSSSPLRHRLFLPFRHCPLPFVSSSFPNTLPLLPGTCSSCVRLPPAFFRRPSGSPAPVPTLFGLQHPPSFQHRSAKHDRTEGLCLALFGRTAGHGRTKALRSIIFGRDPSGPIRGPLFGLVWSNGAGREGTGGSVGKLKRDAEREHVQESGGRVLGKREKTGGRGCERGERDGTEKMYRR